MQKQHGESTGPPGDSLHEWSANGNGGGTASRGGEASDAQRPSAPHTHIHRPLRLSTPETTGGVGRMRAENVRTGGDPSAKRDFFRNFCFFNGLL